MILALDPGTEKTAWLLYDGGTIVRHGIDDNACLFEWIKGPANPATRMVTEMIACYGMSVGREVFETCTWIGKFEAAFGLDRCERITRLEVKTRLCHSAKAKDANVRQALIDIYGGKDKAIGSKAAKGPLYGVATHVWAALAVAVAWRGTV